MKRKIEKGKEFPGQHPDEEVELVFHQHPIVMRKSLIASLIVVTVGALPLAFWPLSIWPWWVFLGGFILAALVFLYRWIGWYYSIFIITNERLIQIKQKGFFDRRVSDISHSKIQSVNYEMTGLQATMFHFGTIIVQTYAGNLVLPFIHNPADIHQLLSKIMRDSKPHSHPNPNELHEDEEE